MSKTTTSLLDAVRRLFPHCVTEAKGKDGQIQPAVDLDLLRQELSDDLVDGQAERYQLNWPGKRQALLSANQPVRKSFFPQPKESLHFETTKNLFIEGDNLDALKLLQEIYLGRIKAIYIDPPYNTGKDFIYKDKFTIGKTTYEEETGARDEEGKLIANPDSSGRYHSNWLSMIYPRLKLARNLLSQNGVIFISIDDNEQHNLRKLCDEIFGAVNFVAMFVWKKKGGASNTETIIGDITEYVICYAREIDELQINRRIIESATYPHRDEKGKFRLQPLTKTDAGDYNRPTMKFGIAEKKTSETIYPPNGQRWTVGKPKMLKMLRDNLLHFQKTEDGWRVRMKDYYDPDNPQTGVYLNLLLEHGSLRTAKTELVDLGFGRETMDTPKPVRLIEHLLRLSTSPITNEGKKEKGKKENSSFVIDNSSLEGDIVMDFFAGSCTTAHAVMKLNKEDGGNRRYIMVQWPEECGEKTEAFKAGYKTIADIGKERIARAAKQLDDKTGFRVLKIGDSNFKDCSLPPEEYKLEDLKDMADNLLPNRKPLDLLLESMLILGLDLHAPLQTQTIQNKQVFFVADNQAIACFEEGLTEEFAKALVKYKPRRVVFLDGGFASDAVRINIEQLFQQLSPATHFTVL